MKTPFTRVLFFILVSVLVVILPWWLSSVVLVFFTIYFPFYLEILFFGFLFDILYSSDFSFPYRGLTIALLFLLIVSFLRTRIRT